MPHPDLLVFVSPALSLSIRPTRWLALLRAHGVACPLAPLPAPDDVARFLFGVRGHEDFADAVDTLDLLACPLGLGELLTAADHLKVTLPRHLPPGDLAALVLARRARDPSLEPLVERALTRFLHLGPSSPASPYAYARELVAREGRRAAGCALGSPAIRELLGPRCIDVLTGEDDDGNFHYAVLRRAPARAALSLTPTRVPTPAVRRALRRDVAVDTSRGDVEGGRIVIRTDDPALERHYADALGVALFGDAAFFTDAAAYTLKSVVALGSDALEKARPPGVSRMRLIYIAWDDGKGTAYSAHGSNALASYEASGGAGEGYVTAAIFRMDPSDGGRPFDVAIELPDRAAYRSARRERLARSAIGTLGVFAPGATPDDAFTLAPWTHAEWRFRRVLGDAAFERLRERGILVPVQTRMLAAVTPEGGKYGWSYISFGLKSEPGKRYAVARNPALRSRDVGGDDVRMCRLDVDALTLAHRADFGAEAPAGDARLAHTLPSAPLDGVLDVGVVHAPGIDLRVYVVLRAPAPGAGAKALVAAMQRASKNAHPFVLLPDGRTIGASVEVARPTEELFGVGGIAAKVLAQVAERKGLAEIVEPWFLSAPGVRFVADEATGRMWLDGTELKLPDGGARMLLCLSQARGKIVKSEDVQRFMSAKRSSNGGIARVAARLGEWIAASFAGRGKEAPADVGEIVEWVARTGWRMTVTCEVR